MRIRATIAIHITHTINAIGCRHVNRCRQFRHTRIHSRIHSRINPLTQPSRLHTRSRNPGTRHIINLTLTSRNLPANNLIRVNAIQNQLNNVIIGHHIINHMLINMRDSDIINRNLHGFNNRLISMLVNMLNLMLVIMCTCSQPGVFTMQSGKQLIIRNNLLTSDDGIHHRIQGLISITQVSGHLIRVIHVRPAFELTHMRFANRQSMIPCINQTLTLIIRQCTQRECIPRFLCSHVHIVALRTGACFQMP